jgi:hypothetical protein
MNALELITKAYSLAGVVSEGFETMNSTQLDNGIYWLNAVTSEKRINSGAIPFRKADNEFKLANGVEKYTIPDLISVDTLTFTDETANLRYGITPVGYQEYFGGGRANNVTGLPGIYFAERQNFGVDIYFYPFPNQVYTLNIRGKFGLTPRTLATLTLEFAYDDFFTGLITYELAKKLAFANDEVWTPEKDSELNRIRSMVLGISGVDMSKNRGTGFASVNANAQRMTRGWMP